MAERVGFEPTVRLPVHRISSAAHSTSLPPLREVPVSEPGGPVWSGEARLAERIGLAKPRSAGGVDFDRREAVSRDAATGPASSGSRTRPKWAWSAWPCRKSPANGSCASPSGSPGPATMASTASIPCSPPPCPTAPTCSSAARRHPQPLGPCHLPPPPARPLARRLRSRPAAPPGRAGLAGSAGRADRLPARSDPRATFPTDLRGSFPGIRHPPPCR